MTLHEIRPNQLRALLLLLVLVPLIPTALMLRFMHDALRGERTVARERQSAVYQQAILAGSESLRRRIAERPEQSTPEEVQQFFRELLDAAVEVRIVDENGRSLVSSDATAGPLVAQTRLSDRRFPWEVQVHLRGNKTIEDSVRDQWWLYFWIASASVIVVIGIAGTAGLAVSRQIQIQELKSTAVATVAHELRTPLASVRMLVDTLRERRCRSETQAREYLDLIAQENSRLSRMAENFLTFSNLEHGRQPMKSVPVKVESLVADVLRPLRARLEAPGCQFICDHMRSLPPIAADRDALHTILSNLLDNALKYTSATKHIELRVTAEAGHVTFSVRDNGVGLPKTERSAIFAPFYQGDQKLSRTRNGCGLGLSIVQKLVAQLGGKISVEGEAGRGSTFSVTIPATPA